MPEYSEDYQTSACMEMFRATRQDFERRYAYDWFDYYALYKNVVDRVIDPDDYHSSVGMPIAYGLVETVHALCMGIYLSGDEIVRATAVDDRAVGYEHKVAAFVNDRLLLRVPRALSKMSLVKKSAIMLGRGVLKLYIRRTPPMSLLKRVAIRVGGMLGIPEVKVSDTWAFQDQAPSRLMWFDYVDPFDFHYTGGRVLDEAETTFEQYYLTDAGLWTKIEAGEWKNLDFDEQAPQGYDDFRVKRMSREGSGQVPTQKRPHRVVEIQGLIPYKETRGTKERYVRGKVQILNGTKRVHFSKLETWNGKPSYIAWEPNLDPCGDRPIGLIEPVEDLLYELQDYENIGLDNARKIVESPLLASVDQFMDKVVLLGPGETNWVRNIGNAVAPLEMKDLPQSFYQQIQYLADLIRSISGVVEPFAGIQTQGSQTATEISTLSAAGGRRFQPLMSSMDRELYRPLAVWFHETARQFMVSPESVQVIGNPDSPFTTVGPDDLDRNFEFSFNLKALDPMPQQKRKDYVELFNLLLSPAVQGQVLSQGLRIDIYEAVRLLLRQYDRADITDRLVQRMAPQAMVPMASPAASPGVPALPGRPDLTYLSSPVGAQPGVAA